MKATKRSQITIIGVIKVVLFYSGTLITIFCHLRKRPSFYTFRFLFYPATVESSASKDWKVTLSEKNATKKSETSAFTSSPVDSSLGLGPAPPAPGHHRHHHNIDSARPRVASGWPLLSTAAPRNTFRCSRASSLGKVRQGAEEKSTARTLYDAATIPSQAGLSETEMETH